MEIDSAFHRYTFIFTTCCQNVGCVSDRRPAVDYFPVPQYMGSATDVLLCIDRRDLDELENDGGSSTGLVDVDM